MLVPNQARKSVFALAMDSAKAATRIAPANGNCRTSRLTSNGTNLTLKAVSLSVMTMEACFPFSGIKNQIGAEERDPAKERMDSARRTASVSDDFMGYTIEVNISFSVFLIFSTNSMEQ